MTKPKEEPLYLTHGLAECLYSDWGYKEVIRQPGYLRLKKPWYKDNPLVGARYDFDYWQLSKEGWSDDVWSYEKQRKIPKQYSQYWLENPYFGIRLRERSVDIVCGQLMNMLNSRSGLLENIELQKMMRYEKP